MIDVKAILITDMPSTCAYCDFCHTKEYDSRHKLDGEKFCGILNEDVEVYYYYGTGRPKFCPLKEIPDKYELSEEYTYENMCDADEKWAFACGWNACIRKIKG